MRQFRVCWQRMSKSEIRDRKMPLSQKNYRDYNFSTRKIEYFAATSKNCR